MTRSAILPGFIRDWGVVELRYFGGMNVEETAEVVGVHPNTVIRDRTFARAWLKRELNRDGRPEDKGGCDAR